MAEDICSLIILLEVYALWIIVFPNRQHDYQTVPCQRRLKPRTPHDCPDCCQQALPSSAAPYFPPVRPWKDLKSRRGAPKRIPTHGFSCPSRACLYYGITDAQVHAVVGDGTHGKHERIQTFRCQACGTTFTSP